MTSVPRDRRVLQPFLFLLGLAVVAMLGCQPPPGDQSPSGANASDPVASAADVTQQPGDEPSQEPPAEKGPTDDPPAENVAGGNGAAQKPTGPTDTVTVLWLPEPIPNADSEAKDEADMKPYTEAIADTDIEFDVVPIPPVVYRIDGRDLQLPPKGGFAFLFSQVCDDPAEIGRVLDALRRSRQWDAVSNSISLKEWLSQYTQNERLMRLIQNVFCVLLASEMSEVPARDAVRFYNTGMRQWVAAGRPRRGNLALMESLATAIRGLGGEIWTRAGVSRKAGVDGEQVAVQQVAQLY